jgi:hypothetical protein
MKEIVDQKTAPNVWPTQDIRQQWDHLLMNEGPLAVASKLEAIRDPIRAASKEMNTLLYNENHYDSELRPVLGKYDFAYGWMDSATSMLIDALKKYASADKALVGDLVKDRYQEWAAGLNTNVFDWIGKTDARIRDKTNELREWPRIADSGSVIRSQQSVFTPGIGTPPRPHRDTIQWNEIFGTTRSVDLVFALFLDGTGPESRSVKIKDAFIESALTGDVVHMQVMETDNPLDKPFPLSEANRLPPDGFIRLVAKFGDQGIPNKQFLEKWRSLWFNAVYDDGKSDRIAFDTSGYFPGLAGPHITRDSNAQKN